ncbi:MAG: TetR/AcrR family transcriptional regulator [Pseudomonadota bacterium]|uniref:TetR/AcrR family transcriptional regulator n=1 Tax=Roseovarius TaxID=74030 RepID=UPI0022A8C328|nr:TetR/AcrR family transcriptional regulator [Roseovarius sp. EGI FJ00037]MCZ0813502.1 helix-turn-helix domain containing protein [Roseovarius sp. EGI FJ00037]
MPRKAAFDRETALKQAMDLFWSRGYWATSLKDIEAKLNMRPGSIYAAFGSKEDLFRSALALYAENARNAFDETLASAPSPLEGLAAHVRGLGRMMDSKAPSRACMLMKTVLEATEADSASRIAAENFLRQTEAAFSATFRKAQEMGQIPKDKDPDRLASRLQAGIMGLRAYAQRSDAPARIQDLADDLARDIEALGA